MPRVLIVEDELGYAVELMSALRISTTPTQTMRFEVDITAEPMVAIEHARRDDIDIYIVDLKFKDPENPSIENPEIGKALIKEILEATNAGLIVHSTMPADEYAVEFMLLGADDYIEKMSREGGAREVREGKHLKDKQLALHEILRAKVLAVWRRVQLTRPSQFENIAHNGRLFLIGDWYFLIGSRELKNKKNETIRISPTEHALLRYLCAVQGHEIDVETFNLEILGRSPSEREKRVDNYIFRIRNRLGPSVQLTSNRAGKYRLLTVKELGNPSFVPSG
ncbi:MAG TPA: hypothetical protein VIJ78_12280 [Pseudolabrys sp.]|nr:hypothetical protein [Pseudolabrys sp.]